MTLIKPENAENWKRKCWMEVSVEYAVEEAMDMSHAVMMTKTKQEPGKLRNNDSIPGIGKGVLSIPKRPDRLYGPLSCLLSGTGRSFYSSKTAGT